MRVLTKPPQCLKHVCPQIIFSFRWLYLEPILFNDEGDLGAKFRKVDQGFKQVARIIEADPRLSALLQSARLQSMLDTISDQLNACQSALNQYIDEKRSIFPRLYFLSDDDLLELLGQARSGAEGRESVLQSHLKKLFPGITGVRLGPGGLSISSLCSHFDETFQLDHPVDIDCPVEIWLKNLESEIRSSLKNMTLKCISTNSIRDNDPFSLPTQIMCLAQNIRFTEQAEKAITNKELRSLKDNIEKQNANYATAEVEDEGEKYKKQALILQCAYYKTVVDTLLENNVVSTADWLWQKQLRFYLVNSKEIVARMGLAEISYSYEYLGIQTGQFVRTELAEECFLILTQALHFGFVGNPFGPAGTGKTESVKALGGLFGRLVLIFNCDEAMDGECMGRLLTGLALSGAWGCFDEFNRLSSETLATVSHQFSSLLSAMLGVKTDTEATALLNGKQVMVSPWCGVAVTLNPAGRGYGARRALSGALQRALRPVALSAPAPAPLATHLLAAHGALAPRRLATDLTTVFMLSSNLLSSQRHYDWGLRALKAAVGSCGSALHAHGATDELTQRAILRTVLKLNNMSKLTKPDAERFENILSLVFADVPEQPSTVDTIYANIDSSFEPLHLIRNELQAQKCMELFEQLQQRMGVVIVGPPGSGKTTIRKLLKSALVQRGKTIMEHVIYPKAVSRECLLGRVEPDTRQWVDGVVSTIALQVSQQPPDVWSWVVCDGDIDPQWIEALNSVLDDNRLLTLPSGWRVQFGHNVNFLFETHSLEHASPATISRMGIILLSEEDSCAEEVLQNWIQKADTENETLKLVIPVLQNVIRKCMKWFNTHKSNVAVKSYIVSMVNQVLVQLNYIMQELDRQKHLSPEEIIYLALQHSVVGLLKENAIHAFHEEMSDILGPPPTPPTNMCERVSDSLVISPRLCVPEYALRAVVYARSHAVLIGPAACAKTALAEHVLKELNATVVTIDCTPILEPADIIAELKRNNVVRSGGGAAVLLVRALHRARTDNWGSAPVHSFLLQLMQGNGFWASEENGTQWYSTARVSVIATASPRLALASRLAAALTHIILPEPTDEELLELLRNYLNENITKNFSPTDISNLAQNILSLFREINDTFDARPHYSWNSSHLKKMCENIKWYNPTSIDEVTTAVNAQGHITFRNQLITDIEKAEYDALARKYLKVNNNVYFKPIQRGDGVYLESVNYATWQQTTQMLINQCLTDDEKFFGDTGIEFCEELSMLCPVIALALNGGTVTAVCGAGGGAREAGRAVCAALAAHCLLLDLPAHFATQFKAALTSASEGNRTLAVVSEWSASASNLAIIEAFVRAQSIHALPSAVMPSIGQNAEQTLLNIRQNLGILICLDKDQDNLSDLLEKYPFLYNISQVTWLERWSEETLKEMPLLVIKRYSTLFAPSLVWLSTVAHIYEEDANESKEILSSIPVEGFLSIYNILEVEWMKSPYRYIHFIKSFYNIVDKKKTFLMQRQNMLLSGVDALRRARSEVSALQTEAAAQEVELSDKREKANKALEQIGATVRANTDKHEEMQLLKKNIELENEKLQIRKKEIEEELATVEPVIAAARAAVGDIKPESLSEVRSLRAPPDVVRDVLEGVLRLMGIADTSWHSMKSFLSKRGVKEDIRCLDASQISLEAIQSVERLLERRGSSFDQASARRASAACAPLAAWVRANLTHAAALARVRPLQAQQRDLHKNLQRAEAELEALSSGMSSVEERVESLQAQLGQHTRDAAALEMRLSTVTTTIHHATNMLSQLAHEYDTWETDLKNISNEIVELNQRSLLAAAYIVYLPDLTEPQARNHIMKWSALIGYEQESFSVINFLSNPEKQLKWEADGLPLDQTALKNAVLIDQVLDSRKCGLTPLIIDPDGDAMSWLRNTLTGTPCEFISQASDKLQTAVQYALRLNRTLVVYDVDSVHAGWWAGRAGRLVLVTRDTRLARALPSYVLAVLNPLYFTARLHALLDQLIHYTMQKQNPEMNEKTKEIKLQKATLQKQLHELQENLLKDLSMNSDILHDANLIASLNKTRETSVTISESLKSAQKIEEQFQISCQAYEESALKAAHLVLAVKELVNKKPLFTIPVETMLDVYVDAVRRVPDNKSINSAEVVKYLTRRIIERVLLSLHKKDKYIIVLHLLRQVFDELIPENLWQLLIGSYELIDDAVLREIKNSYTWIPDECLKKVTMIKVENQDLFNKLSLSNNGLWSEFRQSGDLNVLNNLKLSPFEIVLTVAALRPDSLYRAIIGFVDQILGNGTMSGGDSIRNAQKWSSPRRAALLLGAHAADHLQAHTQSRRLIHVGVEEGREVLEEALEASRHGGWLVIDVGASPFSKHLRDFLDALANRPIEDFDDEFRVWIVAEDRDIPAAVASSCVNVILESAEGVKRNVCSTLSAWGEDAPSAAVARQLACLALLHALAIERRAYVPLGWTLRYEWGWGEVSAVRACALRARTGGAARALCAALYGARVPGAADRRLVAALTNSCMGDTTLASTYTLPGLAAPLPYTDSLQDYITAFENLPEMDSPQLLGLPDNCRVAWEKKAAEDIVTGLREINSTVDEAKNNATAPIKSLLALWKKLMSGSPLIKPDFNVDSRGGWWGAVCAGEARDAARTARAVHRSLAARALHSHTAPLHCVPEEWQLAWGGPDRPDEYLREFCWRARTSLARLSDTFADDYFPKTLDIRSLLCGRRALAALRAASGAARGLAPHRLRLDALWDPQESSNSGPSLVVTGLRLSACTWGAGGLRAAPRGAAPDSCAPPLALRYVPADDAPAHESDMPSGDVRSFEIPLYTSAARDSLVCNVRAPLAPAFSPDRAVLHAAALYVAPVD